MQSYPTLLCTVRSCGQPLTRNTDRVVCPVNHSFDIARSGYINLLQPQDRRSKHPGDSPAAVAGRRTIHELGVTQPLLEAVAGMLALTPQDTLLDVGSGDGYYLGSLVGRSGCAGSGIDISHWAVDAAARRYPQCQWIIANADRFVPYPAASFSTVLSVTARMNPKEFQRVLKPTGKLLIALPAPDDLIELRGAGRDRVERTVELFAPMFKLASRQRVSTTGHLDSDAVEKIRLLIYRPFHSDASEAAALTFSLDLLLFEPKNS